MADVAPVESKTASKRPDPVDVTPMPPKSSSAADADGTRTRVVGGEDCEFYNDTEFRRIRLLWKIPDGFLENFQWSDLKPGGGKGGNPLAFTCNMTIIVKQIEGSDQDLLLLKAKMFTDHGTTDTFMVRFFCHFHRPSTGVSYIAMNNCLPISRGLNWAKVFDLKGCRDDKLLVLAGSSVPEVHKRCFAFWNCWYLACCNTKERQAYYDGKDHALECKFHCTPAQKEIIIRKLQADCDMLEKNNLMDYSLILGVIEFDSVAAARSLPCGAAGDDLQPFVAQHGGKVYAYFMGVIDFLQEWNTGKKIAAVIKECVAPKPISTVNPSRYALQFMDYFKDKFVPDAKPVDLGVEHERKRLSLRGKSTVFNSEELLSSAPASPAAKNGSGGEAREMHSARSVRLMKEGSAVPPRSSNAAKANGGRPPTSA